MYSKFSQQLIECCVYKVGVEWLIMGAPGALECRAPPSCMVVLGDPRLERETTLTEGETTLTVEILGQ